MSTKHKPETPLPWNAEEEPVGSGIWGCGEFIDYHIADNIEQHADAAYIAHAANAYPKSVAVLRDSSKITDTLFHLAVNGHLLADNEREALLRALLWEVPRMYEAARNAAALLRELGEEA